MNKIHIILTEETYFKLRTLKEKLIKEHNKIGITFNDIIEELIKEHE